MPFPFGSPFVASAIAAALSFGAGDFAGGLAARRASGVAVAAAAQLVGCLLLLAVLLVGRPAIPDPGSLALGAAAGIAGSIGIASLYRALATGAMGLVAAISGAGTLVVPLLASVFLLGGEIRPWQIAGVACVAAAVLAASSAATTHASRNALGLALLAALAFGLWYVLLDRAAAGDSLWALVTSRLAGTVLMTAVAWRLGTMRSVRPVLPLVLASGLFDVGGNALYVAARAGLTVGLAATLVGIYPIVTMLLARVILRERLPALGLAGVALALAGIVLISAG